MPSWFDESSRQLAAALAVLVGSLVLGLIARRTVLRRLEAHVNAGSRTWQRAVVLSLRRPILLWFLLGGGLLVVKIVGIPSGWERLSDRIAEILLVVSLTLWFADLSVRALIAATPTDGEAAAPVTSVVRAGVRITVFAVGILVLLETLGVSVTPVLTTVGIGGLALALGLQDTLTNLFAGIHLTLAKNIRVGDFVKLETGQEGYIEDIRWRATRIRTIELNTVLVPNSRLAQNIVINYHLPEKNLVVVVEVGVHYSSDLEKVERVACEVASSVLRAIPGGVPGYTPILRFFRYGASSIDARVWLQAHEFADTIVIRHEFIKALTKRFASEGIVIPYPITAINLDQEHVVLKSETA
jgi:small-conductance mechanosensitive channel